MTTRKRTLIIIPCSTRKRPGGVSGLSWSSSESVVDRLSPEGGGRLLDCRRQLGERLGYPEGEYLGGPGDVLVPLMRASARYDGNLYRKLDESVWSHLASSAHMEVLIVSAVYGLLTPWEAICEYNVKMDKAITPRVSLVRWWTGQGLGSLLIEYVRRSGASVAHDFLSGAYTSISDELLSCLGDSVTVQRHAYPGLGIAADFQRGQDVRDLLVQE